MGGGSRRTSPRRVTSPRRTSPKKKQKPCNPDQIRNPKTGRCVLKRSPLGKEILKAMGGSRRTSPRHTSPKKKEKPCKRDQIRNPKTGRCVSKEGVLGKKLMAEIKKGSSKDTLFPVKRTLADGNCLFSAVFRALRDKNLLDKFNNCYKDFGNEEKTFIKNLRLYLSDDKYLIDEYENMFRNIVNNFKTDKEYNVIFKTILQDMGDVRNILKKYKKNKMFKIDNIDQFIDNVKEEIKKDGSYTGQFEVKVIEDMLVSCDIGVEFSTSKDGLINMINDKSESQKNKYIFLLLRGEHWEYI